MSLCLCGSNRIPSLSHKRHDPGVSRQAAPPAQGVSEVLLPGDPEWRSREARLQAGIPLPEATWAEIEKTASELGVPV